jgi:hypothetical protein
MIELAAALTLIGFGWILTQRQTGTAGTAAEYDKERVEEFLNSIPQCERPSQDTVYESHRYHHARRTEERKGKEAFDKARRPKKTGVISRTFRDDYEADQRHNRTTIKSDLAGIELNVDHHHQNMQPFFGSRVKQNTNTHANRTLLETFTGTHEPGMKQAKREIAPLFKMRPNPEGVYGTPVKSDRHLDRFQKSRIRNNETPFDKVYVAPGLNQPGYGSKGANGYNQLVDNTFMLPKTVDDLRVGNRKRMTYTPPVVPGKGMDQRGQFGKMYQNRPNLTEERLHNERLFVTAAGNEASTSRPEHMSAKTTERQTIPGYGPGIAVAHTKAAATTAVRGVKESDKQQLEDFGFRNLFSMDGLGDEFDHGRDNIILPAQERDITAEATYEGNVTSLVKALVAPIMDVMKSSRKEYYVNHGRTYGQIQASTVPMITVKDPNDVARTTIKETLIHDTHEGYINATTTQNPRVYDPDEIARTTIRETLDSATDKYPGQLQTTQRSDGYNNANVEMKKTQKESLVDHDYFGTALSADKKQMSYEEFFNADTNVLKEGTLKRRAPVYEGSKVFTTADDLEGTIETKKLELDQYPQRQFTNYERHPGREMLEPCVAIHTTKGKMQLPDVALAYRNVDQTVLSSLESNPFALKPLSGL